MADPKATPISQLPRGPQDDDDQQFIQNILKQMNNDNQESEQAYQEVQQNYNKQQFAVNHAEQHAINQKKIMEQQALIAQQKAQQAQYEQMEDDEYDQYEEEEEELPMTFVDKLKRDIKAPLVFLVLFFVLCLPQIRKVVFVQLGRFTQVESLKLYGSSFILGLVGAIIFYIINKFLIKF